MVVSELVALLGYRVNPAGARQFDQTLTQLQNRTNAVAAGISATLGGIFVGLAAGMTAAIGAIPVKVAQAGDEMNTSLQKIESSIGRSATSAQEAEGIYDKLYQMGTRTGVAADESAGAFTRFNLAMQDLKRPAEDTIQLIEGIQAAGIIAGTTTTELNSTMVQLGQALGSGKLQGEELNSLRENMPRFLRDVMAAVNMTSAEFFKAAEKGELNPALLIPAMLKASEVARRELANFPIGMARGFQILRNATTRFLAELDKQLGLSKAIASAFMAGARAIDGWRSGLSIVGDFIRQLGGMENILRVLGVSMLVAFGPTVLAAMRGLALAAWSLARGIMAALLPAAGFAAWVLVIEDFIGWIQGKESLFGERFGDFQPILDDAKAKLNEFKDWFLNLDFFGNKIGDFIPTVDDLKGAFETLRLFIVDAYASLLAFKNWFLNIPTAIAEAWNRNVEGMRPQFEWLLSVGGLLMNAFRPLGDFFAGVFDNIAAKLMQFYEKVMFVVNGVRAGISWLRGATEAGAGEGSNPAEQAQRRLNFGSRGGLGAFPDVSDRPTGAGASVNAPQTNTITNEINVTAPGSDPASVANAAQRGVNQATDAMLPRLDGAGLARGLGMASPRVEAPAQ